MPMQFIIQFFHPTFLTRHLVCQPLNFQKNRKSHSAHPASARKVGDAIKADGILRDVIGRFTDTIS